MRYQWLLHWGEEHLPRAMHLSLTNHGDMRTLAFGALHAVADLRDVAQRVISEAQEDGQHVQGLVAARALLLKKQSRDLEL